MSTALKTAYNPQVQAVDLDVIHAYSMEQSFKYPRNFLQKVRATRLKKMAILKRCIKEIVLK